VPIGGRTRQGGEQELAHLAGDRLRLVEHREHVGAGNLGVPPAGEELGQPVTVVGRHDLVVGGPQHEGLAREASQRLGVAGQGRSVEGAAAVGEQVASDAGLAEHRLGPAADEVVGKRSTCHLTEQQRQPAQPADPQLPRRQPQAAGNRDRERNHLPRQAGWEVFEGLARQDDLTCHALVAAVRGEEQSSAPVGVHERHVLEVERIEQVSDEADLAGQGQVGVGTHRAAVRAQGQDGTQVAETGR
jgi:hypothetical protein